MDEEEFEDEEEESWPEPHKIRLIDLVLIPVCFTQLVAEATADSLEALIRVLASHREYEDRQMEFVESVRAELEKIPTTEEA